MIALLTLMALSTASAAEKEFPEYCFQAATYAHLNYSQDYSGASGNTFTTVYNLAREEFGGYERATSDKYITDPKTFKTGVFLKFRTGMIYYILSEGTVCLLSNNSEAVSQTRPFTGEGYELADPR